MEQRIVMFPFMAQGHIIPFLALAFQLEQKGYKITFVNTPLNIKKLQSSSLPPNSSIHFLTIPFNSSDHGLPPDAENTDVLPYTLIPHLVSISPCLEPSFRKLLSDLITEHSGGKPLCIIADLFFGWSANVANEFGIFHVIFSGSGGFGWACYYSMWMNLPHKKTDSIDFILPDFPEAGRFHVTQVSPVFLAASESDPLTRFQWKNFPAWSNSDGLLFNTVEELDKTGLAFFRRKLGLPVWAIGPMLLPVNNRAQAGKTAGFTLEQYVEWLDSKPPSSVLFVSFGSQNTISASQMMQLAKALDRSQKNFIWVVRPPLGFDINAEFEAEEWLPEGFLRRVKNQKRGLVIDKWAPQIEILSHKSVGAFMSHCGWNSVLESLSQGVPLLGWPMAAEQFFNAKFMEEEVGVCVEMARGTNFDIRNEDIVEKIELVMGENEKGWEIMRKAGEVKKMMRDAIRDEGEVLKGSSVKAMEDFLSAVALLKIEKRSNLVCQLSDLNGQS